MFQRMVAVPYEEYAQLSGNSTINQVKQPEDQQFYDLEKQFANRGEISDPYRRMLLQGETIGEMKALKEKMRNRIASNSPKPYRSRASALFEGLQSFLKFNERGEIFDELGTVVSDSHIEDLIQYAVRDRRRDIVPKGWNQFTTILRKHNVPRYTLNRLTLDEIDGKTSTSSTMKSPLKKSFIFTGSTPASRREDLGPTAKLTARNKRQREDIHVDFTPKKAETTPSKKRKNMFDVLKRNIAEFDTPQKKRRRVQPYRNRRPPIRMREITDI